MLSRTVAPATETALAAPQSNSFCPMSHDHNHNISLSSPSWLRAGGVQPLRGGRCGLREVLLQVQATASGDKFGNSGMQEVRAQREDPGHVRSAPVFLPWSPVILQMPLPPDPGDKVSEAKIKRLWLVMMPRWSLRHPCGPLGC